MRILPKGKIVFMHLYINRITKQSLRIKKTNFIFESLCASGLKSKVKKRTRKWIVKKIIFLLHISKCIERKRGKVRKNSNKNPSCKISSFYISFSKKHSSRFLFNKKREKKSKSEDTTKNSFSSAYFQVKQ